MVSRYNGTQPLHQLGSSVSALSLRQISMMPWDAFIELQKNFTVQWTRGQMHALVKKKLGELKVTSGSLPANEEGSAEGPAAGGQCCERRRSISTGIGLTAVAPRCLGS